MTLGISLIKNRKGSEAVPGCHVVRGDRHCYSETTVCVTGDEVVIIPKSSGACVYNAAKRDTVPVTCCLTTASLLRDASSGNFITIQRTYAVVTKTRWFSSAYVNMRCLRLGHLTQYYTF